MEITNNEELNQDENTTAENIETTLNIQNKSNIEEKTIDVTPDQNNSIYLDNIKNIDKMINETERAICLNKLEVLVSKLNTKEKDKQIESEKEEKNKSIEEVEK